MLQAMAGADAVGQALAAVQVAVVELQEANFNGVEGLQEAKAKLNTALQEAKRKGASESELLEAGKAKTIEVDDSNATGAAARKARKLRQLSKEFANKDRLGQERLDKERVENERAARVAERLIMRRGGAAAEKLEQERVEKGREEKEREEAERAARVAQAAAARRAKSKAVAEAKAGESDAEAQAALEEGDSRLAPANSARGTARAQQPKYGGMSTVKDAQGRSRSRSRGRESGSASSAIAAAVGSGPLPVALPVPSAVASAAGEGVQSLSSLLGRPSPPPGSPLSEEAAASPLAREAGAGGRGPTSMADVPLGVLMGGGSMLSGMAGTGGRMIGAGDLSTGGEAYCHNFSIGRCMRWNCRFKHAKPNG